MLVLEILGWLLLGLLCLLVVLLTIPIHLRLVAESERGGIFEVRLFSAGLPRIFRIRLGDGEDRHEEPHKTPAPPKPKPRKSRWPRGGGQRPWVRRLVGQAPAALADTLRAVRIDRLRAEGWFGLSDPADTGQLWGNFAALRYGALGAWNVDIRPEFERTGFGGKAEAQLHFTLIRLIAPALTLIVRAAPWRN